MSWLFSRALVEEYSAASCLDGEPSAQLNVMPTQHKFWRNDKTMEFSGLSQFGLTCAVLTESRGTELLTWFLAGFPAKTSAAPGRAQELTAPGLECGSKWPASWVKYDRDTSSWKTAQCSLLGDLEPFSGTWPRWGLMRDGACWEHLILVCRTKGSEFGFWPTPCKTDGMKVCCPTTMNRKESTGTRPSGVKIGSSLMWFRKSVERWSKAGWLCPTLHELLMAWPLSWTDLRPLETDKYQQWRQQHGECLEASK